MAGIRLLKEPIRIVFRDGIVVQIEGGSEEKKLNEILSKYGVEARNLEEFGIGTNLGAKVSGIILEDEKALGTIHIALGSNFDFGGRVKAPIHLDGVILRPSVYIDGRLIMDKGRLLITLE